MNIKTQEDVDFLEINLETISKKLSNIHKLISILNKYCKANKENDNLYEISYIVELLENKISELGYDLYITTHNDSPKILEEILQNIKIGIENKQIFFSDE